MRDCGTHGFEWLFLQQRADSGCAESGYGYAAVPGQTVDHNRHLQAEPDPSLPWCDWLCRVQRRAGLVRSWRRLVGGDGKGALSTVSFIGIETVRKTALALDKGETSDCPYS
ncbi:hypothetical protein ANO11243_049640 [Dothideomycetidae sp. 11243]|nr:hypothetical protein ANO11243_049640 [fungal sp. No.11243]